MRLDLCLRHPSQVLAATAIYMATRDLKFPLPSSADCHWWEIFDADLETMALIEGSIRSLYLRPKVN
jgi:hypothetical protein